MFICKIYFSERLLVKIWIIAGGVVAQGWQAGNCLPKI